MMNVIYGHITTTARTIQSPAASDRTTRRRRNGPAARRGLAATGHRVDLKF